MIDKNNDVINQFSKLPWHDAELKQIRIEERSRTSDVLFAIDFDGLTNQLVCFAEARAIYAEVDLLAKRLCSDHIASATCESADGASDVFVERVNRRFDLYEGEVTTGLLLFTFSLVHPGGEIRILAKTFSLSADNRA